MMMPSLLWTMCNILGAKVWSIWISMWYISSFFLFLFWERNHLVCIIQDAGKSALTKLTISGRIDSNQIESGKEKRALLAKASTTALPSLSVWESDQLFKEFKWDRLSMRRWPRAELNMLPFFRALMTILESPSRMELFKPTSLRKKQHALLPSVPKLVQSRDFGFFFQRGRPPLYPLSS